MACNGVQAVPSGRNALCIFEHVYFARPGLAARRASRCTARGSAWARGSREEAPVEARSRHRRSRTAERPPRSAISKASGIPFNEGLIKNRYVARTFIQPDQAMREQGIRIKFNPLDEVEGKRIVVVDDSIVRGNTMRQLVSMLLDAGAAEVHVRVSSPPVVSPCFYGIDMADEDELAAAHRSVEEMRVHIGATSLHYLSVEGMQEATDAARGRGLPRLLHARLSDAGLRGPPPSSASRAHPPDRRWRAEALRELLPAAVADRTPRRPLVDPLLDQLLAHLALLRHAQEEPRDRDDGDDRALEHHHRPREALVGGWRRGRGSPSRGRTRCRTASPPR